MNPLPETVLQFGGGRFLRGFADLFIHQANLGGQAVGRVVVVQSTDSERARWLNAQQGRYSVLVQGLDNGVVVDHVEESASISRALIAQTEWEAVLEVARSPHLRCILSNTTEAGFTRDESDTPESAPPRSFPAKLLAVLKARYEVGGNGPLILPSELLENNADRLQSIVLELAATWNLPQALRGWIASTCDWRNTLVDRIVTDAAPEHPLAASDRLLINAEPFALWVIEQKPDAAPFFSHPAITYAPDVTPYFLRKVRILNGAHTAMVKMALARGHETVLQAMQDATLRTWLEELLFDEIVPTLKGRVEQPEQFAHQVLERFSNPFLQHKLANIAIYHEQKVQTRLVPTRAEYVEKFGSAPVHLDEALAAG